MVRKIRLRMREIIGKRRSIIPACIALLLAVPYARGGGQPGIPAGGSIDNDTVWAGTVSIERSVTVGPGVRLTVKPGTRLLFADGSELVVAGTLRAEGTGNEPVRFMTAVTPSGGKRWRGITLAGAGEASVLKGCVVTNAETVRLEAGAPEISGCTIEGGVTGISVGKGVAGRISGNVIADMTAAGVDCQMGATPTIDNNVIRKCGGFGIVAQRNAGPSISNNAIIGCDVGISYASPAPPAEGNRLENNRIGIGINNVGDGMAILRNRFVGNETGLWVENFSSPRIESNVFDNNAVGIFCYRSSSPGIARNRIVRNRRGIVCQQLSEPRIAANELTDNGTGVFLTLSSYAVMNGNNFDNNAVQVELGVMSHDWEVKVGRKPVRGGAMRGAGMTEMRGGPPPASTPSSDAAVGSGIVDATGNWWGDRDTAEMEAKGGDANIGSLVDGRDTGPQKSEGYEGEFARDRIDYSQWKAKRIPDTGIPGDPVR